MDNSIWTDHVKNLGDTFDRVNDTSSIVFSYEKDYIANAPDDFAIYYDYTNGDETSITISYKLRENDFEKDFSVKDADGDSSKTFTADGTGRIIIPASNLDDKIKISLQYGDGDSTGIGTLAGRGSFKLGIEPIKNFS